ncbi:hypothetical protein, partial [Metabacillus sp. RGM 3146]|uniref:hypothetical protein n=1 Tax=Metabacillus sp. RGM 3146 TaxID=3401092 RepID=UPI003B9B41EF
AALGGFPSHVSTGQLPSHSFVMPFQGVEASYANLMGHSALLLNKPGTPYIFEILRIRQHSKLKLTILDDTFYITNVLFLCC